MEKTVKLEQFKKLTEEELQEIQGGDWRFLGSIRRTYISKEKINKRLKSNGFIWIIYSYFSIFL